MACCLCDALLGMTATEGPSMSPAELIESGLRSGFTMGVIIERVTDSKPEDFLCVHHQAEWRRLAELARSTFPQLVSVTHVEPHLKVVK